MSRFDGLMFYSLSTLAINYSMHVALRMKVIKTQEATTRNLAQYTSNQSLIDFHVFSQ